MKAKANAQDAITTHPELDCLVGLWSYNGPAILSGVRAAGKLGDARLGHNYQRAHLVDEFLKNLITKQYPSSGQAQMWSVFEFHPFHQLPG